MYRPWLRHYPPGVPAALEPPRDTFAQALSAHGAAADWPCLECFGRRLSYRQVRAASDRLAASMLRLGVQPGDRVALLLPNVPALPIALFAALRAGAVAVPLDPQAPAAQLAAQLKDSGAATLVTLPGLLGVAHALRGASAVRQVIAARLADFAPQPLSAVLALQERRQLQVVRRAGLDPLDLRELANRPVPDARLPILNPDDPALLLYHAADPRGALFAHTACAAATQQIAAWAGLRPRDRLLVTEPLWQPAALVAHLGAGLRAGATLLLVPRLDPRSLRRASVRQATVCIAAAPPPWPALRGVVVTGVHGVVGAAFGRPPGWSASDPRRGVPLPGVDARIVGRGDLRDQPPGEPGRLALRTPALMTGFYSRPAETAAALRDGWLITDVTAEMDEDGTFR